MGSLVVPLKAVYPFWAQAANHPLPGDLAYADGSIISAPNQAIVNGSPYTLPDLRNKQIIGADTTLAAGEAGQWINFISTMTASANSYNYQYADQLSNSVYTILSTDYLIYDVYWPSANIPGSGGGCGAVDLYCTDGTALRSVSASDQNALSSHPNTDLRAYALDQWYTRRIPLSGLAGKVVSSALLAHEYDGSFTNLTTQFRQIYIGNSTGTQVNFVLWFAGDGTPNYTAHAINSASFVSGTATTLTAPGPDGVSGTNKQTMKDKHIPSHTHTASTVSNGDHAHSTNTLTHSSHTHTLSSGGNMALASGTVGRNNTGTHGQTGCLGSATGAAGNHNHTVAPANDGSHEHNITVSPSTSTNQTAFDNRPRHLGVVWCVKSGLPTARFQSVPLGAIIMWYADLINETLPTGYSMTDGSSLTSGNHIVRNQSGSIAYTLVLPDTRNRYLIGADRTKAFGTTAVSASDLPTDAPGPGGTGGTHVATIALGNLPTHVHPASVTTGNPWATHNHTWTINFNGDHTHAPVSFNIATWTTATETIPGGGLVDDFYENDTTTATATNTADNHQHTLQIGSTGVHSHTITVNSTGSGTSWDRRIPFIGIVHLMRTNVGMLSVPLKTVVGFRATSANEALVPTDGTWALCNGSTLTPGNFDMAANSGGNYVLPDFRKFSPLGADRTKAAGNAGGTTDVAADAPGPKGTAGTDTITVTSSIMPSHTHPVSSDTQGDHAHGTSVLTSSNAGHAHGTGCQTNFMTATFHTAVSFSVTGGISPPATSTVSTTFASATQPSHTTSCSTAGAHTHTVTIPNAGTGSAMQQRPRHHGLVFYMKVKR
jgi:hypothetical protein